jgi:PAS domain S-box-containing protein
MLSTRMRARTFLLPVALVALTALVQWVLIQFFGAAATYLIFAWPIIVSALLAGFWAGLVANALSVVVAFAMPFSAAWRAGDDAVTTPIRLLLMAGVGLAISLIVERLRAKEHELRRRTAELEQITDTMPIYVVRCGADDTFLFVNHSYAQRFGLSAAEVIGRKIPDVLGVDAFRTLEGYIARALSGEHVRFETEVNYSGIGRRTMSCEYVPERGPDGTVRSYVGVIIDVTDHRRIAAAAEADRDRAQLAADAAELGTWEWRADTGVLACSPRGYELFGIEAGPLTLDLFMATIHPADRDRVRAALARIAEGTEPGCLQTAEFRIARVRDGEERWIRATGRIESQAGRPVCAIGTVQDVTEHHEARAALEQALSREHAARMQAEEASRLKDEFLATLSHELRTPLNAILGYTRMLRAGTLPLERSELALEIVERNARLQRQLVDDILDVSRIITGKLRMNPTILDPVGIVELALDSIRPGADAKRLVLALIVRDDRIRVLADPDRLQQIIWNILTNAVKFTPAGGRIVIEIAKDRDEYAVLTITDTGIGIGADFLPHVFERFRQGTNVSSGEHGGLGLGLAIVRHLTELQGGTIRAHSDGPGKGSTFTLRFPLRPHDAPAAWTAHGLLALSETAPHHGTRLDGVRVLLVDDDRDSLRLLEQTLGECGASVRSAPTATDGLRELEREIPDVILSDIALPGMDGHEFMRTVRDRTTARGGLVPAIALTAYGREEDRQAALAAGYQVHLTKPCDPRALTRAIAAVTGAQPS